MKKLEIAFMTEFWHEILDHFNKTSKFLQSVELDFITVENLLKWLVEFLNTMRDKFDDIEKKAKQLGGFVTQHYHDEDKRIKRNKLPDGSTENSPSLSGREKFKI